MLPRFARSPSLSSLKEECLNAIGSQIECISEWTDEKLERFTRLEHSLLVELLNRDILQVSERALTAAVARWAKKACSESRVGPVKEIQMALVSLVRCFSHNRSPKSCDIYYLAFKVSYESVPFSAALDSSTPLVYAVLNRHEGAVKLLLAVGVDPNKCGKVVGVNALECIRECS